MAGLEIKQFDSPDETRPFADQARRQRRRRLGPPWNIRAGLALVQDHVKPIAQTDSCQSPHLLYVLSGRMKVVMDDRTGPMKSPLEGRRGSSPGTTRGSSATNPAGSRLWRHVAYAKQRWR